jgi:RNA polymerase sigma-70 factor (ECF subfamily)
MAGDGSDHGPLRYVAGVGREGPDWGEVQERLLRGDRLAFLEVSRLISGVLAQLRAYDFRDEWDDLRQEVVLSLVANARAGRLRDPQAFVGYVRIITRNKFVDRLKQRIRRREDQSEPWEDVAAGLPVETDAALAADLRAALAALPADERRAVEGVYVEGRTYEEVSEGTGIPLGTLKRRLRDGLAALRARLAGRGPDRAVPATSRVRSEG